MKSIIYIFLLLFFINPNAEAQCTLTFSGTIIDADTKELLEGAIIEIEGIQNKKISDKNGQFVFEGLCPGHYDLTIQHDGCQTIQAHIHIKTNFTQEYALSHASTKLSEVTVIGFSQSQRNREVIDEKMLTALKGSSLGETLKKITGVTTLQTGTNIYKPVIHGLHSNRVLILNNGIRQEGQQWGNEHAPEIDPFIANRISVIKGSATMRYGGDAIAGVILVEPKLLRAIPGTSGEINLAGFSNNRMGVASVILEGNFKKTPPFSWRLQGTVRRAGNSKTPNYWLANSALKEYNYSATAGWKKNNWGTELFYSQFNTQIGIFSGSHIGNVSDLMNAISNNEPPDYIKSSGFSYQIDRPRQEVQHHLLKSKTFFNTGTIGRLNLIASFQYNNRKEYDKKRFQSSDESPQLDLSIATAGVDIIWDHFKIKNWRGSVGISGIFQDNQYSRRLFIPNYQSVNSGVFWIEKWEQKKWVVEGGVRYDFKNFFNTNNNEGKIYPKREYNSFSGNVGASYKISPNFTISINGSSAWRAPNVNELYSDGLHHGAARLEKGDSSLLPERANNIMTGLEFNNEKWSIETNFYHKIINDFIFLEPTYPPQLTIRGAFPSFRFSQTNARLSGADISIRHAFSHHLKWNTKASLLRAWNKNTKEWLIQMPADRFENEIEYDFHNGKLFTSSYIKLNAQNILKQNRVPATGTIEISKPDGSTYLASDYAPPPAAYMLLGIEIGSEIVINKRKINVTIGASNLFNTVYREYMNAFRYYADEMGRNISIRLKIPFEINFKNEK